MPSRVQLPSEEEVQRRLRYGLLGDAALQEARRRMFGFADTQFGDAAREARELAEHVAHQAQRGLGPAEGEVTAKGPPKPTSRIRLPSEAEVRKQARQRGLGPAEGEVTAKGPSKPTSRIRLPSEAEVRKQEYKGNQATVTANVSPMGPPKPTSRIRLPSEAQVRKALYTGDKASVSAPGGGVMGPPKSLRSRVHATAEAQVRRQVRQRGLGPSEGEVTANVSPMGPPKPTSRIRLPSEAEVRKQARQRGLGPSEGEVTAMSPPTRGIIDYVRSYNPRSPEPMGPPKSLMNDSPEQNARIGAKNLFAMGMEGVARAAQSLAMPPSGQMGGRGPVPLGQTPRAQVPAPQPKNMVDVPPPQVTPTLAEQQLDEQTGLRFAQHQAARENREQNRFLSTSPEGLNVQAARAMGRGQQLSVAAEEQSRKGVAEPEEASQAASADAELRERGIPTLSDIENAEAAAQMGLDYARSAMWGSGYSGKYAGLFRGIDRAIGLGVAGVHQKRLSGLREARLKAEADAYSKVRTVNEAMQVRARFGSPLDETTEQMALNRIAQKEAAQAAQAVEAMKGQNELDQLRLRHVLDGVDAMNARDHQMREEVDKRTFEFLKSEGTSIKKRFIEDYKENQQAPVPGVSSAHELLPQRARDASSSNIALRQRLVSEDFFDKVMPSGQNLKDVMSALPSYSIGGSPSVGLGTRFSPPPEAFNDPYFLMSISDYANVEDRDVVRELSTVAGKMSVLSLKELTLRGAENPSTPDELERLVRANFEANHLPALRAAGLREETYEEYTSRMGNELMALFGPHMHDNESQAEEKLFSSFWGSMKHALPHPREGGEQPLRISNSGEAIDALVADVTRYTILDPASPEAEHLMKWTMNYSEPDTLQYITNMKRQQDNFDWKSTSLWMEFGYKGGRPEMSAERWAEFKSRLNDLTEVFGSGGESAYLPHGATRKALVGYWRHMLAGRIPAPANLHREAIEDSIRALVEMHGQDVIPPESPTGPDPRAEQQAVEQGGVAGPPQDRPIAFEKGPEQFDDIPGVDSQYQQMEYLARTLAIQMDGETVGRMAAEVDRRFAEGDMDGLSAQLREIRTNPNGVFEKLRSLQGRSWSSLSPAERSEMMKLFTAAHVWLKESR